MVLWICGAVVTVTSRGNLLPLGPHLRLPRRPTPCPALRAFVSPEVDFSQLCKAGDLCLPILQMCKLWLRDVK